MCGVAPLAGKSSSFKSTGGVLTISCASLTVSVCFAMPCASVRMFSVPTHLWVQSVASPCFDRYVPRFRGILMCADGSYRVCSHSCHFECLARPWAPLTCLTSFPNIHCIYFEEDHRQDHHDSRARSLSSPTSMPMQNGGNDNHLVADGVAKIHCYTHNKYV